MRVPQQDEDQGRQADQLPERHFLARQPYLRRPQHHDLSRDRTGGRRRLLR